MKQRLRVRFVATQRVKRREQSRPREKALLLADVDRSVSEQLSEEEEKPSEDIGRSWQMRKSPNCGAIFSGPTTGKWCIFVPPSDVDLAWSKVKGAVEADRLLFAKVSTVLRSKGRDGHVICVYTRDWTDRQELLHIREVLRSLGFVKELGYKRDIDTLTKIYGADEWYMRA